MNRVSPHVLDDLPRVIAQMGSGRAPLVAPVANCPELRDVTFLWRAQASPAGVYLFLNRVTDKANVEKGMMTRAGDSDIWTLTLRLPATYRGTYTFTEIPAQAQAEQVALLGGRRAALAGQADPLNPAAISVRGQRESVLALDLAPAQPEWDAEAAPPRGALFSWTEEVAGRQRRLRLYLPDAAVGAPLGLLALPDAESWLDHVGLLSALDRAGACGRIAPTAVLGIDNIDNRDRCAMLGGDRALVDALAARLIPQARAAHPDKNWAGREGTMLAGQSLGGVTALMAARHAPETFGAVISSSPSMWWTPQSGGRPTGFSADDRSWVSDSVLADAPVKVRVRLNIGTLEGAMVPHVEALHRRLRDAGGDSALTHYTGGHDYAWWRGALIDGLAALRPGGPATP